MTYLLNMIVLTVTPKSQVTLPEEVLRHLGVGLGDNIEIELSPDRTLTLRAAGKKPGITSQ